MFGSSIHWQIVAIEYYIQQVIRLPIDVQSNIQNKWIEVAKQKDPRNIGWWDDCGKNDEDCPYIVVIFEGLPFEFTYRMDTIEEKIILLDCYKIAILHPNEE